MQVDVFTMFTILAWCVSALIFAEKHREQCSDDDDGRMRVV